MVAASAVYKLHATKPKHSATYAISDVLVDFQDRHLPLRRNLAERAFLNVELCRSLATSDVSCNLGGERRDRGAQFCVRCKDDERVGKGSKASVSPRQCSLVVSMANVSRCTVGAEFATAE